VHNSGEGPSKLHELQKKMPFQQQNIFYNDITPGAISIVRAIQTNKYGDRSNKSSFKKGGIYIKVLHFVT
jgi:hypothetical protein